MSDDPSSSAPTSLRVDGRAAGRSTVGRAVLLAAGPNPRLSWRIPLIRAGQEQRAFRVRAHLRTPGAAPTVIDSGVVASGDPWWIVPDAVPPYSVGAWTVSVLDEHDDWSDPACASVETGPHTVEDWRARWVAGEAGEAITVPFTVPGPVRRARLHLTGRGLVRSSVDSTTINPDSIDPSRSDFPRALYRTFDITDLCGPGVHELGLILGNGHFGGDLLSPCVLAEVVVEHDDGAVTRAGTSDAAPRHRSRVVVDEPFYLERHDLRIADPGPASGGSASSTPPRARLDPPEVVLVDPGPLVQRTERRVANELPSSPAGRVFDVGVNISGRVRLRLRDVVPIGTAVRLVHGEHLGLDGHVDTTNLALPHDAGRVRQVVEFITDGSPDLILEPWFSYAGFRYVEITGLPAGCRVDVVGWAMHSDIGRPSRLDTDATSISRLDSMARRTLLNTLHGLPEDCPTREQAAWTGDTASALDFDLAAFDMEAFFAKWLGDLVTSQLPDGAIPAVAPRGAADPIPADPVWGAALPRALRGHWLHYGDRRVLDATLPALRRWVEFLLRCVGASGVVDGAPISYGHDWLALRQTPPELLHTAATLDALEVLAGLEADVGRADAAEAARADATRIRRAARRAFVAPAEGNVANGSQAALALAITTGLFRDEEVGQAARRLIAEFERDGRRVTSGFGATRAVVEALSLVAADDLVAAALDQPDEPGIGAMLAHHIGTFWECWWVDPENTGTGSLDHVGLGAPFAAWIWRSLVGSRPLDAGSRTVSLDPRPVPGVDRVNAVMPTVRGDLGVRWLRAGDDLSLDVEVPVTMEVVLAATGERLTSGQHHRDLRWSGARRARAHAPEQAHPFAPPVIARRPADVDRAADLLVRSTTDTVSGIDGAEVGVLREAIRCMPVPHEQQPGPLLQVVGRPGTRSAVATLAVDLDLAEAAFFTAALDTDASRTERRLLPMLVLHADDGTTRSAVGRLWPAGWNRVAVDVGGWTGRRRILRIDVGVVAEGDVDDIPPTVHVASLGWSGSPRRW